MSCSISGIHLGLAVGKKAFVMYDPTTHRIHKSCNIHFFKGMLDSEQVTIEFPDSDSPLHVEPDMTNAEDDIGDNDGKDVRIENGYSKKEDDAGGDVVVLSGQPPIALH